MKPTSMLKKISVAGLLASCIFLVNCGKSNDDSKLRLAEKLAADKMLPACSEETKQWLTERSELFTSVRAILEKPLDDAQKQLLQDSMTSLSEKSQNIMKKVRASKVAGFPATGCTYKNSETETKFELSIIKSENLALAKRVSKANDNKPNEVLLAARPIWKAGDKLKISSELAQMISNDDFVDGKRMVYDAKVVNGGADFILLKNKRDSSLCISAVVDGQGVTADDVPEIAGIAPRLDNTGRIIQDITLLIPSLSGERSLLLTCILADASDLNDAMVDTFGSLLEKEGEL